MQIRLNYWCKIFPQGMSTTGRSKLFGYLDPSYYHYFSSSVDLEKEKRKRLEYEQVAERLKPLVLKKDTPWLSAMVNSAHTNTQRILLSKLLEENRFAFYLFKF
jgi:hypothetical protein